MKYAILFGLAGVALIWRGLQLRGWGYCLVWIGISLMLVSLAYAGVGPRIFGKSADGKMSPVAVLALLPYLLGTWAVWHARRWITNAPVGQEIEPGLWLGRRPYLKELPAEIGLVIDLAAEFPADAEVTRNVRYISAPVLDAWVPDDDMFKLLIDKILAETEPIFVHCAVGYGRSATLMAAVLIKKGLACDVEAAEKILRAKRPGVRLNRAQRRLVSRVVCSVGLTGS